MSASLRTSGSRWLVIAAIAALLAGAGGCFNDGFHNQGVISGGGRFALVIEAGRTPIEGTHFLVDTATGDLWRLDEDGSAPERWLRVSNAPTDVAKLERPHFLGDEEVDPKP